MRPPARLVCRACLPAWRSPAFAGCGSDESGERAGHRRWATCPRTRRSPSRSIPNLDGDAVPRRATGSPRRFPLGGPGREGRSLEMPRARAATGWTSSDDVSAAARQPVRGRRRQRLLISRAAPDENGFVAAIQVSRQGQARVSCIEKTRARRSQGEQSGAKVYDSRPGHEFAVDGDSLVFAGSRRLLNQALDAPRRRTRELDAAQVQARAWTASATPGIAAGRS